MPKKPPKDKGPISKAYSILALGGNQYQTVIYTIQDGAVVDVEKGEVSSSRPDVANQFQRIIFTSVVVPMVK